MLGNIKSLPLEDPSVLDYTYIHEQIKMKERDRGAHINIQNIGMPRGRGHRARAEMGAKQYGNEVAIAITRQTTTRSTGQGF